MSQFDDDDFLVLIVDDTPDTISMLNEVLEKSGMSTLVHKHYRSQKKCTLA